MAQYKIVLGEELRGKLNAVAAASGESVANEIRARLEESLRLELEYDATTRGLAVDVMNLATVVRTHIGQPWHVSADARAVLRGAILQLFAAFEPGASPKVTWAAASKPEIVGHTLATAFLYDQQTGLPRRSMAQLEMRRAELWKNELADTTSELALVEITPQEKHQMGSRIIAVESEPAGTWCWRYGGDVKGGFASEADAVADVSRAIHERRSHE